MKKQRGITLIALVVTIVVLLILAGVSIAMLKGDNGIITKATEARQKTKIANIQEEVDLWKDERKMDKLTSSSNAPTLNELLDNLENRNLITSEQKSEIHENGELTIDDQTIVFAELITFYITCNGDELTYKVEKGTTWKEFIIAENPIAPSTGRLFNILNDGEIGTCNGSCSDRGVPRRCYYY